MRNYLIIILMFFSSQSCINADYGEEGEKIYTLDSSKTHRFESRYRKRLRPSEAAKPGISKAQVEEGLDNYYEDDLYDMDEANQYDEIEEEQYRGHFKIGNKYKIEDKEYIPQNYDHFEEIGIASWYGAKFHGKKTANGEIYNKGDMTAAHPTLPLPSVVRVTNLSNQKSIIVRVNDRGPFAKERIIDLSEKAAEELEYRDKGTTQVKVELLREETNLLLEKFSLK